MNLRQMEQMVNVLKNRGYDPETEIFIGSKHSDGAVETIVRVTRCFEEESEPAFVILSAEPDRFPNCDEFNRDYGDGATVFPETFPDPKE